MNAPALRAALEEIMQVQVKDSGYGPERYTSGDGHARCVEIARAALATPEAGNGSDG